MKVRLTRKHANQIDGIDLSGHEVGDMLDLPDDEARLIVAENWAHPDRRVLAAATDHERREEDRQTPKRSRYPDQNQHAFAADRPQREG